LSQQSSSDSADILSSMSLHDLKQILSREKSLLTHSKLALLAYLPAYEKLHQSEKNIEQKLREIEDYIEVMGRYEVSGGAQQEHDDAMSSMSPVGGDGDTTMATTTTTEELDMHAGGDVSNGDSGKKRKQMTPSQPMKKSSPTQRKRSSSDTQLTQYGFTSHKQKPRDSMKVVALSSAALGANGSSTGKSLTKKQRHFRALQHSISQMKGKLQKLNSKMEAKLQFLADLEHGEAEGHELLQEQLNRAQLLHHESTVYSVQLEFSKMENDILLDEKRKTELQLQQHRAKLRKLTKELGVWKGKLSSESHLIENLEKKIESDEHDLKCMQEQVKHMASHIETQNLTLRTFTDYLRRLIVQNGKVVAKDDSAQITLLKNPSTKKLFIDLQMQDLTEEGQVKSTELLHICYSFSDIKKIQRRSATMFSLHLMHNVLHFETDTADQANEIVTIVQDFLNEMND